jgi:NAD(P)-dependent dehydrogenase (short-subunit alcohol dehydrogenase family)
VPRAVAITGAGRGVGRATAEAFAAGGAGLLLVDVCGEIEGLPYPLATREDLERTGELCRTAGARVVTAVADVRRAAEVEEAFRRGREELGGFDVLVNNAGVVGPSGIVAHELDEAAWDVVVDIDLSGPWRCAKAVLPDLIARRAGAIVNVASTAGLVAFPHFANYVAAKHGLVGLTRALALDYAPYGIRVNAVAPTSIRDDPRLSSGMLAGVAGMLGVGPEDYEALSLPHHPLGSLVTAEDVAQAIVWLSSEAAVHVTGAVVPVDAGFSVR